jgi:pantothenate kinase
MCRPFPLTADEKNLSVDLLRAFAGVFHARTAGSHGLSGLRRMASRQYVLIELARHIVRLSPDRITRVAVDGVDGAGKITFANELADAIRALRRSVIRASVDGFHHPRAVRYERGRYSPEGYFEDS